MERYSPERAMREAEAVQNIVGAKASTEEYEMASSEIDQKVHEQAEASHEVQRSDYLQEATDIDGEPTGDLPPDGILVSKIPPKFEGKQLSVERAPDGTWISADTSVMTHAFFSRYIKDYDPDSFTPISLVEGKAVFTTRDKSRVKSLVGKLYDAGSIEFRTRIIWGEGDKYEEVEAVELL